MIAGAVYLDAVLEPPRSLSAAGLARVMFVLGSISFLFSIGFLLMGAYPVVGFLGAEVLLLWYLMKRSMRGPGPRTHLRVTAESVEVCRIDRRGREQLEALPSYFARVVHDARLHSAQALRIVAGRRYLAIGEHLSREEQLTLATRLKRALHEARNERFPTEGRP